MELTLTFYQVLCLLGIPSLVTMFLAWICKDISLRLNKNDKKTEAVEKGLQALLRSQMINDYNKWQEKGYAPIYARENFTNVWNSYHALGANGVMDDIKEKFMQLPTQRPDSSRKNYIV